MKITLASLSIVLGSITGVGAIERPGEGKEPVLPKGGILGRSAEVDGVKPSAGDKVAQKKVAYLGVRGEGISNALKVHLELEHGLLLSTVDPTSPAGLSGLQENDIILSVGETELADQDSLRNAVLKYTPGDAVSLKLVRRGKVIEQEVTLGDAPAVREVPPMALIPDPAARMNRLMNQRMGARLGALGGLGDEDLQRELMDQVQRALGGRGAGLEQLRLELQNDGQPQKQGLQNFGSVRLMDQDGSVQMKMNGEKRTVIVRDKAGEVLFEGPYNSDAEKAAVPEEFRDRVKRLDLGSGGPQFKLNLRGVVPKADPEKEGE